MRCPQQTPVWSSEPRRVDAARGGLGSSVPSGVHGVRSRPLADPPLPSLLTKNHVADKIPGSTVCRLPLACLLRLLRQNERRSRRAAPANLLSTERASIVPSAPLAAHVGCTSRKLLHSELQRAAVVGFEENFSMPLKSWK